ncbi:MAG: hypothetical protein RI542_08870, partial [Wenzhouxiangella sp.]|nr:hypothetical protein [Wenzhouxiangella sp.]
LTGMAGMVSVSNAVNVNPDGMGQVLLYPYYSARGGNDTLISIVNTTERGKAVKIRFREALNSRDVLDFHIYMSPYDVWTAAVTATDAGGAKLLTSDTTCTVPYISGDDSYGGSVDFLDFDYAFEGGDDFETDPSFDGGPKEIERTASGYIEVIEMASMLAVPDEEPEDDSAEYVAWAAKHADGEPNDCQALVNAWTENAAEDAVLGGAWLDDETTGFDSDDGVPTGGLFGSASIISVSEGTMFSYNATAIDGFFDAGDIDHEEPGLETPNLETRGTAATSYAFNGTDVDEHTWDFFDGESENAMLALNAVITHDKLMNEYTTDPTAAAQTEWVVTFPTKKFHVDGVDEVIPPFTRTWSYDADADSPKLTEACEDVSFVYYDREEAGVPTADTPAAEAVKPVVSPKPPIEESEEEETIPFQLCREANVIRFASDDEVPAASEILKESSRADTFPKLGYSNFELPYASGWAQLELADVPEGGVEDINTRQSVASKEGEYVEGLPVIGFGVTTYTNGNIGDGVLANYGGTFQHRTSRNVAVSSAN